LSSTPQDIPPSSDVVDRIGVAVVICFSFLNGCG
jgi:hypothetical protein